MHTRCTHSTTVQAKQCRASMNNVQARGPHERQYETLLQVTVGQEETEEDIMRDIKRTFPQHPRFVLDQGQAELYNVLKAYSMLDMEARLPTCSLSCRRGVGFGGAGGMWLAWA